MKKRVVITIEADVEHEHGMFACGTREMQDRALAPAATEMVREYLRWMQAAAAGVAIRTIETMTTECGPEVHATEISPLLSQGAKPRDVTPSTPRKLRGQVGNLTYTGGPQHE